MNAIELQNVSYIYSKDTPFCTTALDNVSLAVKSGTITGLMGHTGSGKSTLVQLFNGLNRPDSGKVLVFGEDIWKEPKQIGKYRFKVGLVFQYPEYQLFEETVRRDIAFGPANMKLSANEIEERVEEAADFCDISSALLDKSPFDLSGGQKRRVAIAGIMAMRPDILVLDEPAAGLDPRGRNEILDRIKAYRDAKNTTVIIVSHSMEDVAKYSDEIIVMNRGKCFMSGDKDEIFKNADALTSVGLDIPNATKLSRALNSNGVPTPDAIYSVGALADSLCRLFEAAKAESSAQESRGDK